MTPRKTTRTAKRLAGYITLEKAIQALTAHTITIEAAAGNNYPEEDARQDVALDLLEITEPPEKRIDVYRFRPSRIRFEINHDPACRAYMTAYLATTSDPSITHPSLEAEELERIPNEGAYKVTDLCAVLSAKPEPAATYGTRERIYKALTGQEPPSGTFPPPRRETLLTAGFTASIPQPPADAPTGQQGKDQAAPEDEKPINSKSRNYMLRLMYVISQMERKLDITDCHTASQIAKKMQNLGIATSENTAQTISGYLEDMRKLIGIDKKN